jgi:hypothetical protein
MIGSQATLPCGSALVLSATLFAGVAAGRMLMALDERTIGEPPLSSSRRTAKRAGTLLSHLTSDAGGDPQLHALSLVDADGVNSHYSHGFGIKGGYLYVRNCGSSPAGWNARKE